VVDLAVTGLICFVGTQAFRLIQRLRHGGGGWGDWTPWQRTPFRPGGSSRSGPARRPPARGGGPARRARRSLH